MKAELFKADNTKVGREEPPLSDPAALSVVQDLSSPGFHVVAAE